MKSVVPDAQFTFNYTNSYSDSDSYVYTDAHCNADGCADKHAGSPHGAEDGRPGPASPVDRIAAAGSRRNRRTGCGQAEEKEIKKEIPAGNSRYFPVAGGSGCMVC